MRLGLITSGLDTGGAEMSLLRLLPAMRAYGVESKVVSLKSEGTVGPKLRDAGIPVLPLGLPKWPETATAWVRLMSSMRDWAPGLLHGWMYHGNLAALAATRRLRLPVAWGVRQSLGLGTRDKWLTRIVISAGARLSARPDLIVYNSAVARNQHEARGYCAARGRVVPNGYDTAVLRPDASLREMVRVELGIAPDAPVVAQVARFHPAKDYPTFLRASGRLHQQLPDAMFVLIGDGVDSSNRELASLADELGLSNSIRLLGRRDDVARLMTAFDIVCLSSSGMEGFPNVIGEAMSCGVPCVGTAVGDVAELIGDTGAVVPPGDAEAVAAAVGRLLALEPAARRALGERARQRIIERYSIGEVARRYAELLHSVVERHN